MNKKELNELRKNFSEASDLFTLNHVVSAFVDAEKNIRCVKSNAFHNIPSEESECYMETLRRVLAGTLGKGLLEYEFPNEAYEETGAQNIIYNALMSKMTDDSAVSLMLDQIVKNMDYVSTYAILIGHCTYTVFNKTRNDEINPYDSLDYSFLVTAICPVEVRVDGLIYNEDDNAIVRKTAYDRIVSEVPSDGFLYPTFTGRGPDVNHVLYSVRKPKEVNVSIVENVLGCKFVCTAVQEKESFHTLMQDIVADELSYTVITDVNEKLKSIAEEYKNDADLPAVDDIQMRDILLDSGVSEEKAEKVQNLYREITREKPLSVCNLTENKTVLTAEGITIQIAKDATQKVRTQYINGRRYLLIDLDEPQIQVNGMQVTLQEMPDVFMEESEAEEAEAAEEV
ncbi:MAG: DUF4317 domain-containing protein [Ruminococcus sp.]|nr:DUF4317 domain-containing protein [Ruminococcus sp.]